MQFVEYRWNKPSAVMAEDAPTLQHDLFEILPSLTGHLLEMYLSQGSEFLTQYTLMNYQSRHMGQMSNLHTTMLVPGDYSDVTEDVLRANYKELFYTTKGLDNVLQIPVPVAEFDDDGILNPYNEYTCEKSLNPQNEWIRGIKNSGYLRDELSQALFSMLHPQLSGELITVAYNGEQKFNRPIYDFKATGPGHGAINAVIYPHPL